MYFPNTTVHLASMILAQVSRETNNCKADVSARLQWVSLSSGSSRRKTNTLCARGKSSESKVRHCRVDVLHRQDFGAILFDSKPGPHFPIPSTNGREHHELGNACWDLPEWRCGTIVEDWGSERRNSKSKQPVFPLCSSEADWGWWHASFARYPPYVPQLFAFFFFSVHFRSLVGRFQSPHFLSAPLFITYQRPARRSRERMRDDRKEFE